MGAYLSTPNTDKNSCDNVCRYFNYGASSMQGWRMSQEDAHNCIPDFDPETNTSMFAVYDGHGGSEVAQFCSSRLPDFIRANSLYREGKLGDALEEAFLGFDQKLLQPEVLSELKVLAGLEEEEEEVSSKYKSVNKSEAQMLQDEAEMPLEDLLAQYEGMEMPPQRLLYKKRGLMVKSRKVVKKENTDGTSANSGASPTNTSNADLEAKDILANGHAENENNLNMEKEQIASRQRVDSESPANSTDNIDDKTTGKDAVQGSTVCSSDTVCSASAKSECTEDFSQIRNNLQLNNSSHNANTVSNSVIIKDSEDCVNVTKCSKEESDMSTTSHIDGQNCSQEQSSSNHSSEMCSSSSSTVSSSSLSSVTCSDSCSSTSLKNSSTESSTDVSASNSASTAGSSSETAGGSSTTSCSSSSTIAESGSSTLVGSGSSECEIQTGESGSSAGGSGSSAGGSGLSAGGSGSSASGSGHKGKKSAHHSNLVDDEYEEEILLDDEFDSDEDEDEDVQFDSEEEDDDEEEEEEESTDEEEEEMTNQLTEQSAEPGYDSGSTAVVALLRDREVVVANVGDSRCIISRAGKAMDLSLDHKPEDADEKSRIEGAGGKVTADGRVNGGLNLSRALGDHLYKNNKEKSAKEQMITALPDIQTATLQEGDEFMVIACDGIWNYMSSQEVVDFVKVKLKLPENKERLSKICEELFDYCLAPNTSGDGTGCDNMTCIIVDFEKMWKNSQNKRTISDTDSNTEIDPPPQKRCKVEDKIDNGESE